MPNTRKEQNYIQKCLQNQRRKLNGELNNIMKMKCTHSKYAVMNRQEKRTTEYHHDRISQEKSLQRDLTKANRIAQRIELILEKIRKDLNNIKNHIGNYNFVNTEGDDTNLSQGLDTRQAWKDTLCNLIKMTRNYSNQQYLGNYTILHSHIITPSLGCRAIHQYRDAFHYNTPLNDELCIAPEVTKYRDDSKCPPETHNHNQVSNNDLKIEGMYLLTCVDPNQSREAEEQWYNFLYCIVHAILASYSCPNSNGITSEIISAIRSALQLYNLPCPLINALIDIPSNCCYGDPNLKSFVQRIADNQLSKSFTKAITTNVQCNDVPTGDWYTPSDESPLNSQLNVVYGWYTAISDASSVIDSICLAQVQGIEDEADILFVRDIIVHKMNEIRSCQVKNDLEISNIKYVRDVSEASQTYHEEVFSEMTEIDETELCKRYEIGKSLLHDLNELYKDNCVTKQSFFLKNMTTTSLDDGW